MGNHPFGTPVQLKSLIKLQSDRMSVIFWRHLDGGRNNGLVNAFAPSRFPNVALILVPERVREDAPHAPSPHCDESKGRQ